jgi:hypothetical protein
MKDKITAFLAVGSCLALILSTMIISFKLIATFANEISILSLIIIWGSALIVLLFTTRRGE